MPKTAFPPALQSQTETAALTTSPVEDFVLGVVVGAGVRTLYTLLHNTEIRIIYWNFPSKMSPWFFEAYTRTDLRALSVGLSFMLNERYKHYLEQPRSAGLWWCMAGNVAAGGAAGATSMVAVFPLWIARNRLGTDVWKSVNKGTAREFSNTVDCIIKTARTEGWLRLYRGFTLSCAGASIYRGVYFGLYDTINDSDTMQGAGFWKKFAVACAVTVTAMLLWYPLHTINNRMMATSGSYAGQYKNALDCARRMLAEEGLQAFYRRGQILSHSLVGGLVLVGFEYGKQYYLEWKHPEQRGKTRQIKSQPG